MDHCEALDAAEALLGHRFEDRELLESALTHASIAEHRLRSNERLEFLGDAILGLVICEELFHRFPKSLEGDLTRIKSVVVSRDTCAHVANRLGLVDHLHLGKGISGAASLPSSLAACALEACIGALYLDAGLEPARAFILEHMTEEITRVADGAHRLNYKSILQQYAQRALAATPHYEVLDEKGPDHAKAFEVAVVVEGRRFPSAWGPSKKSAEQRAAMEALKAMGQIDPDAEPAADDDEL